MAKPAELEKLTGLASRFGAFVAERHPFALADSLEVFETVTAGRDPRDEAGIDALRAALRHELTRRLQSRPLPPGLPDTTPRTSVAARIEQAHAELLDACDGFLRRAAIEASLTREERLEILRGMVLTRATDNRLKTFFLGGEVRFGGTALQGKGFRSLGQEAIYGAAMRLRRGPKYRGDRSAKGRVALPCRSWGKADRRSANGPRRSTCAPCGACRRSSASRTIRPRCRRRWRISRPPARSPRRRRATACLASRSTGRIPRRL